MRYHISHKTVYRYDQPVRLGVHHLRLRPRSDGSQHLQAFAINIQPPPGTQSDHLDAEGNACLSLWFSDDWTSKLIIETTAEVQTFRVNPYNYLSEPWAIAAPVDYPQSLAGHLAPYLRPTLAASFSPPVVEFAQSLLSYVQGNVGLFLSQLTQTLYEEFEYHHRPEGAPQPPSLTMRQKAGSCRDFAMLFVEACQAVGLAARFVSGYQEGDEAQPHRELHAWPEVYIPGGGWRGFDPTHGLAVADRHIPLAAAAHPQNAAPVSGVMKLGQIAKTSLDYVIRIQRSPD